MSKERQRTPPEEQGHEFRRRLMFPGTWRWRNAAESNIRLLAISLGTHQSSPQYQHLHPPQCNQMQSKVQWLGKWCLRAKQRVCASLCVCCVRVEGREVTSQCARLRQINHSFTGVCVVSSHCSLGAQDKQCEVGNKVGPSHTLLSRRRFPLVGPVVLATGWEVNPIQTGEFRAVWSMSMCVCRCVWVLGRGVGVFVLCEHEPVSQEKKMRTRIDGRNEEEEKQKGKSGDRVHEQNMNLRRWHCSPAPCYAQSDGCKKKNPKNKAETSYKEIINRATSLVNFSAV